MADAMILILAYFIGTLPSGLLVARAMGMADPRASGSGNIGATNLLRTGGKKAGACTFLMDAAKGIIAVLLAKMLANPEMIPLAAFFVVIGHCFPVWLKFKGGKGVATTLGVLLAYDFPVGLLVCVMWLAVFYRWRISSLAALVAVAASPVLSLLLRGADLLVLLCIALMIVVAAKHHANIQRLVRGEEPRFGK
ncbi:MAG: glycerol-3-phosphate 1-O-acyltransferase PlsY [Hyphomicrobiales bacterium]|nr:glycerol-3-phosphate 1-O-acyltransferase PlsY [Hyphomicrobiales bacterium]